MMLIHKLLLFGVVNSLGYIVPKCWFICLWNDYHGCFRSYFHYMF